MNKIAFTALIILMVALSACAPRVYTQHVPISTNPIGATLYVDGKPAGLTPQSVELERNRDHVLTIVKDGYVQEDVMVTRQYDAENLLINALTKGLDNLDALKANPAGGLSTGLEDLQDKEKTGEAYILVPRVVTIRLRPTISGP